MGKPSSKKANRITRALMTVLTVILIFLFLNIMSLVADIQGTARVVNYAGLVRGTTQRIVKLEDAQNPQDKLIEAVDSYIEGLRYGSDDLGLVRLNDDEFQTKMNELAAYYELLTDEIQRVRELGYENTDIIDMSETFFGICDQATKLAETYSQEKATALNQLENVVVADIAGLLALMALELARAIRTAAQNRALQKKVYLDEATGLPNKNKCEELLDAPDPIAADAPVAVCVFDMNNLRTINNSLGHDKGDEYIRSFADQLAKMASPTCFVGRDGGDEFIAIVQNASHNAVEALLAGLHAHCERHSQQHPAMPISYAAGYALSTDFDACTMRELFRQADKNMYIDKNQAKMRDAAARHEENRRILKAIEARGYRFSDCLYCDAELDQYRTLRSSSNAFLADEGSFSGAVEQTAHELQGHDQADMRASLQLFNIRRALATSDSTLAVDYRYGDHRGRLTAVPLDFANGKLHHFVVGFTPFHESDADEKRQISHYYDQLKHSILENNSYVDAMLSSSQAAYAVDFTHDRLEHAFGEVRGNIQPLNVETPCSYNEYCAKRAALVTDETLESFRLADTSEKVIRRFESGENQLTIEFQEIGRDGKPTWRSKNILMTRDVAFDQETGATSPIIRGIILFKDTSSFHEQEQEEHKRLEAALSAADSQNKAKTEFMNRMSHDFRTPINGIMGMLEIIKENEGNPEKVHDCLGKIQLSADHLLDLVNDVLDMSKLESGKVALGQDPFDLNILMDEVASVMAGQLAETSITHHSHHGDFQHTQLLGSPLRLRQIMLNLFSNAVKYNKQNGTIDTYASEISSDGESATFEFRIVDTGIGMSQDFIDNELFSPFTQENNGARTRYVGTGLGMSIVKNLIDAMGGTIEVASKRGEGTAFTFRLSFKINQSESIDPSPNHIDKNAPVSLKGKLVLIVEDNALNMEIAEFYLTSAGAEVIQAWNGKDALDKFEASTAGAISCILMDIMMPVMDGFEATKRIRALDRPDAATVPIIAMTANAFEEDRKRAFDAGMNGHFSKPLDTQKLLTTIRDFL